MDRPFGDDLTRRTVALADARQVDVSDVVATATLATVRGYLADDQVVV
jgi:hypothetical protein